MLGSLLSFFFLYSGFVTTAVHVSLSVPFTSNCCRLFCFSSFCFVLFCSDSSNTNMLFATET